MKNKIFSFIIVILIVITSNCSCKASAMDTTNFETNSSNNTIKSSSENSGLTLSSDCYLIEELILTQEITFPDGTKMSTIEGDAQTIVMINGTYAPDIQIKIIDDVVMLPAKTICERLGFNVTWVEGSSKIIINNNDITLTFKANDTVALVNNEKFTLASPPKMINDTIYVPWVFVAEKLNLEIESYNKLSLFSYNPVFTIDQELNQPYLKTKEGLEYLKEHLNEAYTHFKDNYIKLYDPEEGSLLIEVSRLKEHISNLKYDREFSRYYVYEGLDYRIYLDKYNKDVYFGMPHIASYEIKKIDFNDPKLFETSYML